MIGVEDYLHYVDRALDEMCTTLLDLGDGDANRGLPVPGSNTPYAIVTHCLGVIDFWAGHRVAGRVVTRDRHGEFGSSGAVAALVARVHRTRSWLGDVVADAEPAAPCRGHDRPETDDIPEGRTQGGALVHVLEELCQHVGHLQVTADLLRAGGGTPVVIRATKYAVRERERRFRLAAAPAGLGPGVVIRDRYLDGTRLRLRETVGPDGSVTRKLGQKVREGSGPGSVLHTTTYLDDAEWAVLSTCGGRELVKRRHQWPLSGARAPGPGLVANIDVFENARAGLVLAEIDLGDRPVPQDLQPVLERSGLSVTAEVTDDEAYTGGALAGAELVEQP